MVFEVYIKGVLFRASIHVTKQIAAPKVILVFANRKKSLVEKSLLRLQREFYVFLVESRVNYFDYLVLRLTN